MWLRKLFYFFRFPIIVFILNVFLVFFGVYDFYPWIDIPMHLIGGIVIAYSFILIFNFWQERNLIKINNKLIKVFLIVAVVALFAVIWEFWEYAMDYFFNLPWYNNLWDTMLDLFLGIFGGFIFSLFSKV